MFNLQKVKVMKTIKNLFLMLSVITASMFGASAANAATCSAGWVNVTGVYEYNVNGTTYGYIYTVPEHNVLPAYTNYFVTYNKEALIQAKMALQNHQTYYLYGDSGTAACPTSGSYRYLGTLSYLYEY
ncbi:hypothetical protein U737_07065 [Methylomonas sp. LW13]|nr:hypothetical protein CWO84_02495 [Methylomonas sp. Kb3]QBC26689.1 hypothetical protein U737_07065 [Methylomonas sp. LW13]